MNLFNTYRQFKTILLESVEDQIENQSEDRFEKNQDEIILEMMYEKLRQYVIKNYLDDVPAREFGITRIIFRIPDYERILKEVFFPNSSRNQKQEIMKNLENVKPICQLSSGGYVWDLTLQSLSVISKNERNFGFELIIVNEPEKLGKNPISEYRNDIWGWEQNVSYKTMLTDLDFDDQMTIFKTLGLTSGINESVLLESIEDQIENITTDDVKMGAANSDFEFIKQRLVNYAKKTFDEYGLENTFGPHSVYIEETYKRGFWIRGYFFKDCFLKKTDIDVYSFRNAIKAKHKDKYNEHSLYDESIYDIYIGFIWNIDTDEIAIVNMELNGNLVENRTIFIDGTFEISDHQRKFELWPLDYFYKKRKGTLRKLLKKLGIDKYNKK